MVTLVDPLTYQDTIPLYNAGIILHYVSSILLCLKVTTDYLILLIFSITNILLLLVIILLILIYNLDITLSLLW